MQVILLQDVEKVGLRGDVVDVARGYARNYLLPRRLAQTATSARVSELRRVEAQRATQEARTADQANEIAEVLSKTVLRFEVKAGSTGSLFGSVTSSDVADEIWRTRKVRIDRRKVALDPVHTERHRQQRSSTAVWTDHGSSRSERMFPGGQRAHACRQVSSDVGNRIGTYVLSPCSQAGGSSRRLRLDAAVPGGLTPASMAAADVSSAERLSGLVPPQNLEA